jgi:predicted DsbA family dithiol-disulfide isomerase
LPGTITIWSDITCPWATTAIHNLRETRAALGLDGDVVLDHRAFPLELFNNRPTPRRIIDGELAVVAPLAPSLGWRIWPGDPNTFPSTVLLPLEAVQAAKEQSLAASEALDHGLRRAFFSEGQPIQLRHVVLEVAAVCPEVDESSLEKALDDGLGRRAVIDHWRSAPDLGIKGSPHLFLPDGTDVHNPGVTMGWAGGEKPKGFPNVAAFDPSVYEDILRRSAG